MLRKKKIFIVDDDSSVRKSLARLLRSVGFDVSDYASGSDFLKKVSSRSSGCLILDVHMPGQSGLELQSQIDAQGFSVVTIFITADKSGAGCDRVNSESVAACLQKPFTRKQLLDLIQEAFKNPKLSKWTEKSVIHRTETGLAKSLK